MLESRGEYEIGYSKITVQNAQIPNKQTLGFTAFYIMKSFLYEILVWLCLSGDAVKTISPSDPSPSI